MIQSDTRQNSGQLVPEAATAIPDRNSIQPTVPPVRSSGGTVVIQASRGWTPLQLRDVWEYRDLLYYLTTRTLKGRYRQMALGPLWSVIQPLVNMVIYSVIFGVIAKLPSNGVPYPVFSYVALLPWDFYSDSINAGSGSLVGSTSLISKVYFPRLILPFSQVISSLYDFALSFVFLIALLIFYGIRPTWGILLLPLFLAIAAMLGLGVGLVVAGPTVRYRDIRNLLGYVMRIWMYATPVVYSASLVPPQWLTLYQLNPMYAVIEGFRWALVGTAPPPAWTVAWAFIISIVLFVVGMYLFRRSERDIVDVL